MERYHLDFGQRGYDIVFERSFGGLAKELEKACASRRVLLVTDSHVKERYASSVCSALKDAGFEVELFVFEAGERNKNIKILQQIYHACIDYGLDRKSVIAALGGGVVGDMAGFAAASYMRGISFVQIPTTLLAQTDSSVGGKVGIDFAGVKNIVGAFLQPDLVYINSDTLKTLSRREFSGGMAEVVKYGMIYDADFFAFLEQYADEIMALENQPLQHVLRRCCEIKAQVVMQDETEQGLRAILNFGHTVGHGIESAMNFSLLHGECVAIGMVAACRIAAGRGYIDLAQCDRLTALLKKFELPVYAKGTDTKTVLSYMNNDKKKVGSKLKFILPHSIGSVTQVTDVTEKEIEAAIGYVLQ